MRLKGRPATHPGHRFGTAAATLLVCLAVSMTAHAAIYAKYDGIDGEATLKEYDKWNAVESLNWPIKATASTGKGGTGDRTMIVTIGDIEMSQTLDKSYPKLLETIVKGETLAKVDVHFTALFEKNVVKPYLELLLEKAVLTKLDLAGDSDDRPDFDVALAFQQVTARYTRYDPSGKKLDSTEASWDLVKGTSPAGIASIFARGLAGPEVVSAVPLPAALWGFVPALAALAGARRRRG